MAGNEIPDVNKRSSVNVVKVSDNINNIREDFRNVDKIRAIVEAVVKEQLNRKHSGGSFRKYVIFIVVVLPIITALSLHHTLTLKEDFKVYKTKAEKRISTLEKEIKNRLDKSLDNLGLAMGNISMFRTYYAATMKDFENDLHKLNREVSSGNAKMELIQNSVKLQNKGMFTLSGWYTASNNFAYKRFPEKVDYVTARQQCQLHGARLISAGFRDSNLRRDIFAKVFVPNTRAWIGLDDLEKEGVYVWSDGITLTDIRTVPWRKNEPNNGGGNNEDCGEYLLGGSNEGINDCPCSAKFAFVCEKSVSV